MGPISLVSCWRRLFGGLASVGVHTVLLYVVILVYWYCVACIQYIHRRILHMHSTGYMLCSIGGTRVILLHYSDTMFFIVLSLSLSLSSVRLDVQYV